MERRALRAWLSGIVSMMAGSAVVLGSVVLMNKLTETPSPEERETRTSIDLAPKPKPEKKRVVQRPKPKPRPTRKAPPNPLRGLDSNIAGIDLGLPGFGEGVGGTPGGSLLGDMSDVVMTDESVDVPPTPKQQSPMMYPARAKREGVTGYVVLNLLINATGSVEKIKVLESSPNGVFDDVAVRGVRQWRFEAAKYDGKSVRVWARQKIRFDLS